MYMSIMSNILIILLIIICPILHRRFTVSRTYLPLLPVLPLFCRYVDSATVRYRDYRYRSEQLLPFTVLFVSVCCRCAYRSPYALPLPLRLHRFLPRLPAFFDSTVVCYYVRSAVAVTVFHLPLFYRSLFTVDYHLRSRSRFCLPTVAAFYVFVYRTAPAFTVLLHLHDYLPHVLRVTHHTPFYLRYLPLPLHHRFYLPP